MFQSSKPIFYTILSLIPLLNLYPLRKLKKTWKMFFIDLGIVGGAFLASFVMVELGFKLKSLLPMDCALPLFLVVQAICVYNWSKANQIPI